MRWHGLRLLCAFVVIPFGAVAGAAPPADSAAWFQDAFARLIAKGGADSLVAAALLQPRVADADRAGTRAPFASSQRSLGLLDRAAKELPDAPDIAALRMWQCAAVMGCDVAAAAQHLGTLAPGNALAEWPALQRAQTMHDAARVTRVLSSVASAAAFETYWVAIGDRVSSALLAAGVPPFPGLPPASTPTERRANAIRAAVMIGPASRVMPPYQYLVKACATSEPEFAARRADCSRIGALLERGDTLVAVRVGLLLRRRSAADAAARARVLATERALDWQLTEYNASAAAGGAAWVVADWQAQRAHGGELGGVRARLKALGRPLEPPVDWIDAAQKARQAHLERRGDNT